MSAEFCPRCGSVIDVIELRQRFERCRVCGYQNAQFDVRVQSADIGGVIEGLLALIAIIAIAGAISYILGGGSKPVERRRKELKLKKAGYDML